MPETIWFRHPRSDKRRTERCLLDGVRTGKEQAGESKVSINTTSNIELFMFIWTDLGYMHQSYRLNSFYNLKYINSINF